MADQKKEAERRKHKRFRIRSSAFAVIGSPSTQNCFVIDISVSGISFRYFEGTKELKTLEDDEAGKMDIYTASQDFYIDKIPFETIYDFEIDSEMPLSSITLRRRGVKFGKLTRKKMTQLKNLS